MKENNKLTEYIDDNNSNNQIKTHFLNNITTLSYHSKSIGYLDKLKDGRLVSCSNDSKINVYKKYSFELELSIIEHSSPVGYFTQLNDNRIISCSYDRTMRVIKLIENNKYKIEQIIYGHNDNVCKVIEIRINELISVSNDKSMKVWVLNKENKFEIFKNIIFCYYYSYCDIFKLNEKEFVTSSFNDKCLKFWNTFDYSNIFTMDNILTICSNKTMCIFNEDILCVSLLYYNISGFYIIKISSHELIKTIFLTKSIFCINKCIDGLLLCSIIDDNKNNYLVKYEFNDLYFIEITKKKRPHNNFSIYSFVELDNGIIASGGEDHLIKLWEYNKSN